ncbi:MAG: tRNA pseudouridine(38-40) synthase TruA [Lachnospiraceae bacterium]|nr:tRNA pseudouridine(38-40) synthase TruA [Lachnospiraceae bacterium]
MLKNYRITISYDGTRYDGWQKQKNTENTIQGKLEVLLSRMAGIEISVHGSGRTDAGVHALGQTANFRMDTELSEEELFRAMNEYLPDDIAVLDLRIASERFHSRLSAAGKVYRYRLYVGKGKPVFERKYVWQLSEIPDIDRIREAAGYFIGQHDFKAFCKNHRMKKSTVRCIRRIDVEQSPDGKEIDLTFEGNGFLQNMVRILTGTLVECGLGFREPEQMEEILESGERNRAGRMAPAKGLILIEVKY